MVRCLVGIKQWVQFYSQLVEICTFIDTLTLVTETCSPAPQGCSNERVKGLGENVHHFMNDGEAVLFHPNNLKAKA